MERMFDKESFDGLKDASEVESAVSYLAHNQIKFEEELASEGLSYEEIKKEVAEIWTKLLKLCKEYNYSDYIVKSKQALYKAK